jgi:predicted PurR-regulated permease PerM/methanogenic corrinoid protein MtbC1
MEELRTYLPSSDSGHYNSIINPLLGIVISTAVLYLASGLLLPVAMGAMLAIIFSPVANRLDHFVGRFVSAAIVVVGAVAMAAAIGYFLTIELTSVAMQVSDYSTNIGKKLAAIERSTPTWLQHIEAGIKNVQLQLENTQPKPKLKPKTQTLTATPNTQSASPTISDVLDEVIPIATSIGKGSLVIVLLFFLLYGRRDLRDRFVRLAARGRITIAAEAVQTAIDTVGRYLLFYSMVNFGFGVAVGVTVWSFGLPNPAFWGGLAFLFRFVPYIGAICSAALPTLVAFAIFPGWTKSLEIFGLFVILDQLTAQLIEPFLIGRGIGVSPVALLFSAVYWAWLWGIPGLLLSTPLTACLKVVGDYIPPLGFLSVLLGAETTTERYQEYYLKLLELNQEEARELAMTNCHDHGIESTFDDIIAPSIALMGSEREVNHISLENQQLILDTTRKLIIDLGNRFVKPRRTWRFRAVGVCAPGEVHNLGLLMLLESLRQDGGEATFLAEGESLTEASDFIKRLCPDVVCVSCTLSECVPAVIELVSMIRRDTPTCKIIAGGKAAWTARLQLLEAGCSHVLDSRREARRAIRGLIRSRNQPIRIRPAPTEPQLPKHA